MKALIFLLAAATEVAFAVAPDTLWSRTYGGPSADVAYAIARTTDSGFVMAGATSSSFGSETSDVYVVRTDRRGNVLWSRCFDGAGCDEAQSVCLAADGGYAVAGLTSPSDTFLPDAWLIRLDANGDTVWTRAFGGSGSQWASCVIQTPDSGFLLCGGSDTANSGNSDVYLVRTNSEGEPVWSLTYELGDMEMANSVVSVPGSGYAVCGPTYSWRQGDAFLLRVSEGGSVTSVRNYGTDLYDWVGTLLVTSDSGFLLAGEQEVAGAGIGPEKRGGVDRAGRPHARDQEWNTDLWILRTSATGDSLGSAVWGDSGRECAQSMQHAIADGYVVAGTGGLFSGAAEMLLLRFTMAGEVLWATRYCGLGGGEGTGIAVSPNDGYVVAGYLDTRGAGKEDALLVKFGSDAGIRGELDGPAARHHTSSQTIARGVLTIGPQLTAESELVDATGRRVMELRPGANDVSGVAPGVYFVQEAQAQAQTVRKVVIQR